MRGYWPDTSKPFTVQGLVEEVDALLHAFVPARVGGDAARDLLVAAWLRRYPEAERRARIEEALAKVEVAEVLET